MGNSVSMKAATNPFAFPAILAVNKNQTAKNAKSAEGVICNDFKVKAVSESFASLAVKFKLLSQPSAF